MTGEVLQIYTYIIKYIIIIYNKYKKNVMNIINISDKFWEPGLKEAKE
jgi:hypothetical protein